MVEVEVWVGFLLVVFVVDDYVVFDYVIVVVGYCLVE